MNYLKKFDYNFLIIFFSISPVINFLIFNANSINIEILSLTLFFVLSFVFFSYLTFKYSNNIFYFFNFSFYYFFIYAVVGRLYFKLNIYILFQEIFLELPRIVKKFFFYSHFNFFYLFIYIVFGFILFQILKRKFFFNKIVKVVLIATVINYLILVSYIFFKTFNSYSNIQEDNYSKVSFHADSPDFAIIVLDEYGNKDVMQSIYNYDNSGFYITLENFNFKVFHDIRSHTTSTNQFIPDLLTLKKNYSGKNVLNFGSNDSPYLFRIFGENNYNLVYNGHCNYYTSSDKMFKSFKYIVNSCFNKFKSTHIDYSSLSFFNSFSFRTYELLHLTPLKNFADFILNSKEVLNVIGSWSTGNIVKFNESFMKSFNSEKNKKNFLFSYSLQPHAPFYYDSKCLPSEVKSHSIGSTDDARKYFDQLECINMTLIDLIKNIEKKFNDPVIIILSDHGTRFTNESEDDKKKILFAVKIPQNFCKNFDKQKQSIDQIKSFVNCLIVN